MFFYFFINVYIALLLKITILRTTDIYCFLGTVIVLSLVSFQEPKLKKRITDKDFKYEFYVTDDSPRIKEQRIYYWFKGGAIHTSENGTSGQLLHDTFEKFYLNNQLAEKGNFESGLKVGLWRTWHQNGVLKSTQDWASGRRRGMYLHYNDKAVLIEKGRYYTGKKQGQWINFITKDTIEYNRRDTGDIEVSICVYFNAKALG